MHLNKVFKSLPFFIHFIVKFLLQGNLFRFVRFIFIQAVKMPVWNAVAANNINSFRIGIENKLQGSKYNCMEIAERICRNIYRKFCGRPKFSVSVKSQGVAFDCKRFRNFCVTAVLSAEKFNTIVAFVVN